jgi:hypothetical protein
MNYNNDFAYISSGIEENSSLRKTLSAAFAVGDHHDLGSGTKQQRKAAPGTRRNKANRSSNFCRGGIPSHAAPHFNGKSL